MQRLACRDQGKAPVQDVLVAITGEDWNVSVVIVTGAARGIGRVIATHLSGLGWTVVCADIDQAGNAETARLADADAIGCNVGDEAEVASLVAETVARHRSLDAIVSNAGINLYRSLADWNLADWNRIIATNLTANFLLARSAEQHLRRSKGAMVLMASSRAYMSEPGTFAYSASKGGIVALTHCLAMSLQPDVRVNCISPGWIDTGKHGPIGIEDHAQHPVGRVGRPQDIAEATAFLLSAEKSGFITGQDFVLDGGMTRKMIYV